MDEEIAKSLRSQRQPGYSTLTEFVDRTFDGVFTALKSCLEGTGQARG
jgi:hypothetical protein